MIATTQASPPRTARERLGAVITHLLDKRGWDPRRIANFTHVSASIVAEWRAGRVVPRPAEWRCLKQVNSGFAEYAQLYQEAMNEQEQADEIARVERQKLAKSFEHRHRPDERINTSLGDKMRAAIQPALDTTPRSAPELRVVAPPPPEEKPVTAPTQPAPAKTPRKQQPNRPIGSLTADAILRRENWVRDFFRQRPHANVSGPDGAIAAVIRTFGIGIKPDRAREIRREIKAEASSGAGNTNAAPKAVAPTKSTPPPMAPAPSSTGDIATAAALIVDTIPNLKTFTITVDESGAYDVAYTIREVRIVEQSNTLKGSRK